ncbi:MAG TPA: gamma-glutamyl-gamma-aminobutyrate hydrolase family protein [Candidatus Limnocylindrales bacterium]|nr:gamma-glutamyl-gamma-aminobutyrate hydrolase family protein [Candidatus Limnocylindrales bacterium]
MGRPAVGITTYTPAGSDTALYSLPRDYIDALARADASPVLMVPHGADALDRLDGLVLTGGGDIDPSIYGADWHETNYFVDPVRDRFELDLAREAMESGLPLLAICRGLQIVNVALGGTLVAHLPERYGEAVAHRAVPRSPVGHCAIIAERSLLAEVVGAEVLEVHSWHHQCVDRLGRGLTATAHAEDGVVEALELENARGWMLAVQWHPELGAASSLRQQAIFDAFARAAALRREQRSVAGGA